LKIPTARRIIGLGGVLLARQVGVAEHPSAPNKPRFFGKFKTKAEAEKWIAEHRRGRSTKD
jgi:hypothetical protein